MPRHPRYLGTAALKPAPLAELLRSTALQCRATVEVGVGIADPIKVAIDLAADICEECAIWLEDGVDLDATPHIAAILQLLEMHTEPGPDRRCRVCGCTDSRACRTDEGACHWTQLFGDGTGICSNCPVPQ